MEKKRKRHIVGPYILRLLCVGIPLMSFAAIKVTFIDVEGYLRCADNNYIFGLCLFYALVIFFWAVVFYAHYWNFGTVEITESGLIFRALFGLGGKRVFLYDELEEFGMDYSLLQGHKTYRIYFCKKPFDPKWRHNILRISPHKKDYILMDYNEKIYRELYENVPLKARKRMPMPWHEDSKLEKLYPQKEHVFYVTKAMMK